MIHFTTMIFTSRFYFYVINKMYSDRIGETRMCVQQILPQHHNELKAIYQSDLSPENQQRLRAAFFSKKLWPAGSKIRIGFLDSGNQISKTSEGDMRETGKGKMDPLQNQVDQMSVHQMIRKIVRERIQPLVDLQITFVDNPEQANVRISFDPTGGAWSLVGTDHLHQKSGATMNLGWFDVATTMHEFGHMLGMIHEHQNPKGDKIKWNDRKVFAWAKSTQGWSDKTTEENIIIKKDEVGLKNGVMRGLVSSAPLIAVERYGIEFVECRQPEFSVMDANALHDLFCGTLQGLP